MSAKFEFEFGVKGGQESRESDGEELYIPTSKEKLLDLISGIQVNRHGILEEQVKKTKEVLSDMPEEIISLLDEGKITNQNMLDMQKRLVSTCIGLDETWRYVERENKIAIASMPDRIFGVQGPLGEVMIMNALSSPDCVVDKNSQGYHSFITISKKPPIEQVSRR